MYIGERCILGDLDFSFPRFYLGVEIKGALLASFRLSRWTKGKFCSGRGFTYFRLKIFKYEVNTKHHNLVLFHL